MLTFSGFAAEWDHRFELLPYARHKRETVYDLETHSRDEESNEVPVSAKKNEPTTPVPVEAVSGEPAVSLQLGAVKQPRRRTIILVEDVDFITMHNILYYLYTGCVNLHFLVDNSQEFEGPGYPDEADAFLLFRAANMYMLEGLEDRCYHYLSATCSSENIIERLFETPECAQHDKIRNMYLEYLNKNFDSIKNTKPWEDMMLGLTENSEELLAHKSKLLFEISKMTFGSGDAAM